jgi:RecA-family ATPase
MFKNTTSPSAVETGVHFQSAVASTWLVSDLLPSDEFCAIYGQSKSGKRAFALQLGLHVAAGMPFLGRAVTQGEVVYLTADGPKMLQNRVSKIAAYYGIVPGEIPFYPAFDGTNLATLTDAPALIVLDGITDDDDEFIVQGETLRDYFECAVLGVHHSGREHDAGMAGQNPMLDEVDSAFIVKRKGEFALINVAGRPGTMEMPILK